MDVWRICRSKYEASAFSGHGAEKTGGRWNYRGHPAVYASQNLSLAVLELFVHVSPDNLPADRISIRGTLPDKISADEIDESALPGNWREYPAPDELQRIGTDWLVSLRSVVLIVPSAINPREKNFILNPAHPEIRLLIAEKGQPFAFDPRMFGK